MRKSVPLLLVLVLAVSAAPFGMVEANPYGFPFPTHTSAPDSVNVMVDVESPQQTVAYSDGTLPVRFKSSINSPSGISTKLNVVAAYQGDWMNTSKWSPFPKGWDNSNINHFYQYDYNLSEVPLGQHTLNITIQGDGSYNQNQTQYAFMLRKTVSITFYMSTSPVKTAPIVTLSHPQNLIVETSTFPLNFTVNQPTTNLSYSLDGQGVVHISGNTTLTGLADGQHNVTVYASDGYGNNGASEALFFNVNTPESAPASPLLVYLGVALVVAAVSITIALTALVYFRKRAKCNENL
jgi:hypothetical protein